MRDKMEPTDSPLRRKLYQVMFETDTPLGQFFDVALLWLIVISVVSVILESVEAVQVMIGQGFFYLEWLITILFLIEYLLRLYSVRKPLRYAFSFFGVIDLLSILPTFLSFYFVGSQSLLVIRGLRLLRIFRVLKLARYSSEARVLMEALRASRAKITVFLVAVLGLVLIMGSVMYLVEGPESGFTSIPRAIYWAIVTMTTVGYGDLVPQTALGQFFASAIMICGYAVIAVPTGILSVGIAKAELAEQGSKTCVHCQTDYHRESAKFCDNCGLLLEVKA